MVSLDDQVQIYFMPMQRKGLKIDLGQLFFCFFLSTPVVRSGYTIFEFVMGRCTQ